MVLWSPPPVPHLACMEELLIDVLAAGLTLVVERLVLRLIRRVRPA